MPVAQRVPVAFWLLPSDADSGWLSDRIRQLARRHEGPEFEPHITLHVGSCAPRTDIESVLDRLSQGCAALTLAALHTGQSTAYYKALFVNIASEQLDGARLTELRRQLVHALLAAEADGTMDLRASADPAQEPDLDGALASYDFLPHLSLLYGELPQALRQELAVQQDLHGRSIDFDRVAAVRPARGFHDLSQVSHWNVFGHRRLAG